MIFKIFYLIFLLLAQEAASDSKIVGGNSVNIEDYSYTIIVVYKLSPICGGSIIKSNYVLTAAHCLTFPQLPLPNGYLVRAGSSFKTSKDGVFYSVKNITVHPRYNSTTVEYDIGLLKIGSTFPYTPVTLAKQRPIDGTTLRVLGWGSLSYNGSSPVQLQMAEILSIPNEICQKNYPMNITENMLCAGVPEGGKDACQGDSGGPLIDFSNKNPVQVGIVSFGINCGDKRFPGVYTDVAALYCWINQTAV